MLTKRYLPSKRVVHRHAPSVHLFPVQYDSTESQVLFRSCFFQEVVVASHFMLSYIDLSTVMCT